MGRQFKNASVWRIQRQEYTVLFSVLFPVAPTVRRNIYRIYILRLSRSIVTVLL